MSESQPNPSVPPASNSAAPGAVPPGGPSGDGTHGEKPATAKPKKRRWLRWVIGAGLVLVLLLLVMVALVPTIISSAAVRSMVVSRVNDQLNGKLEIQDWSFGWTSGARITGLRIFDSTGRQILQLKSLDAPVSLLGAIAGHYDLHSTLIDSLDIYVRKEADGTINFADLAKKKPEEAAPSSASDNSAAKSEPASSSPLKLPLISGEFAIKNGTLRYDDVHAGTTLQGTFAVDEKFNTNNSTASAGSLQSLSASGGIDIATFSGNDIDLKNLRIPLFIQDGLLYLANSEKPDDLPPPASLNGGQLSLAGFVVDLTDPHHLINVRQRTQIMHNVELDKTLADLIGNKLGNPLFADSGSASGLLSVAIDECKNFPADATATQNVPSNQGTITIEISVANLNLAGGNVGNMLSQVGNGLGPLQGILQGALGGGNGKVTGLRGDLKDYKITLAHGVTTHDMTLAFGEHQRSLSFTGQVNLSDMKLNDTALTLPMSLFGLPDKQLPNGLNIALSGTVEKPQLDVAGAIQKTLTGKNGGSNPLDLLNGVLGKKKQKSSNDGDQ